MAPGTVARGYAAKWSTANDDARPEFCMPTSILKAMRFGLDIRRAVEARYPKVSPSRL
jgi:hypothetical protein